MVKRESYSLAWGVQSNLTSLAYLIGPAIATYLLVDSETKPFYFSLIIFVFCFILTMLFLVKSHPIRSSVEQSDKHGNLITELKIWKTLTGRIWMLWIIWFLLWCVDATVWSVGIIFAEDLKEVNYLGSFFVPVFMIPHTFTGLLVPKLATIGGKKKLAFMSTIVTGAFLILLGIIDSIPLILVMTFLASSAMSLAFPALSATFEDYIGRIGKLGPEMIGLEQTASSLGYVVGPICAGAIASLLGNQPTFSILGYILITAGILAVMIVPRKIYMPQKELQEIEITEDAKAENVL
jgi:MFS family permease